MIKYRLGCDGGHEFESWFGAIADFDAQLARGLISCPICGSVAIEKLPMAPAVVDSKGTGNRRTETMSEGQHDAQQSIRAFKQSVLANSEDVGTGFAEEARRIHFGEAKERNIRGDATASEARSLIEEGIPFGVIPRLPEDHN